MDLLYHLGVVILQQTGLGAHLHGDHPRQLQVVELLFKAVAQVHHVVVGLGILGKAGFFRLDAQLLQLAGAHLLQPFLAGQDVHGQFLVVLQVQLIHLIEHGNVLHQRDLMLFQRLGNAVHIGLHLAVLGLHALDLVAGLAEQTRQPLLLLAGAKALQLHHQLAEVSAHLAQILAAHIAQGVLGEARHALLGGGAVLQDHVGVGNVDLLGKLLHSLLLLLGKELVVQLHRLHGLFLRGLGHSRGIQGQLGNGGLGLRGVQGQFGGHILAHSVFLSFL